MYTLAQEGPKTIILEKLIFHNCLLHCPNSVFFFSGIIITTYSLQLIRSWLLNSASGRI